MRILNFKNFLVESSQMDLWSIIPQSIKDIHKIFNQQGKKLYIVGGAVRDFLRGDDPKDFDLTTNALPDEVLSFLQDRYNTNIQGKAYGTIVVYTDDQPDGIEITTFRQDISKGRNPQVKLGVTIEDDVKRRDITFNALFYDLDTKEIVDLTGGKEDLNKNIIKMVGNASERFDEDSLRILRAFRFASRYKSELDESTKQAIKNKNKLTTIDLDTNKEKRISQERIWSEFTKAWKQSEDFNFFLSLITEYDMWGELFPNSKINTKLINSDNFVLILSNLFLFENPFDLENKMVQVYKIEIEIAKKVVFLLKISKFDSNLVYDYYKEKLQSKIDNSTILEWGNILKSENIVKFSNWMPVTNVQDLIRKGFKKGDLGREIRRIEVDNFLSKN